MGEFDRMAAMADCVDGMNCVDMSICLLACSSFFLPSPNSLLLLSLVLSFPVESGILFSAAVLASESSSRCRRGTDEFRGLLVAKSRGAVVEFSPLIASLGLHLSNSNVHKT